jgi:hypothetical protein
MSDILNVINVDGCEISDLSAKSWNLLLLKNIHEASLYFISYPNDKYVLVHVLKGFSILLNVIYNIY